MDIWLECPISVFSSRVTNQMNECYILCVCVCGVYESEDVSIDGGFEFNPFVTITVTHVSRLCISFD